MARRALLCLALLACAAAPAAADAGLSAPETLLPSLAAADEGFTSEKEAGAEAKKEGASGGVRAFFERLTWSAGGFLGLYLPAGSTADTSAGVAFAGQGIATFDLLPGRDFPLPSLVPFRLEMKYAGGTDRVWDTVQGWHTVDVSSFLFQFKIDYGVDLLWTQEKMWLFPFVGIGSGLENTWGAGIGYGGTDFVVSFQFGAGFAYLLTEKIYLLGRAEFCVNGGAGNIGSDFTLAAGAGFLLG